MIDFLISCLGWIAFGLHSVIRWFAGGRLL